MENTIVELTKKISRIEADHSSLLYTIETLKNKNYGLMKRFKSEFHSLPLYKQALFAYK